jgi:hypothetical protein
MYLVEKLHTQVQNRLPKNVCETLTYMTSSLCTYVVIPESDA